MKKKLAYYAPWWSLCVSNEWWTVSIMSQWVYRFPHLLRCLIKKIIYAHIEANHGAYF